MLIFLAGLAVLLALAVLGSRASTHLFHHGEDEYFVRCIECERRHPRQVIGDDGTCPEGHPMSVTVIDHRGHSVPGTVFVALCLGFALTVLVIALTGHHLP